MTKAKPVISGQTVYATAKVVRDEFWLRDDENHNIRNLILYLVAHYATKHGILVHSMVVMSNHYHLLLTDARGQRDLFFKAFHSTLSKHIASLFSKSDASLLQRGNLHQMVLLDQATVEEQHIYTLLNPVRANIVERYQQYTHVLIDHYAWNNEQVYTRPAWFSKYQWTEEELTLVPVPPSYFKSNSNAQNIAHFDVFVAEAHTAYDIDRKTPVIGMDATYLYPRHYSPTANDYVAPDDTNVFGARNEVESDELSVEEEPITPTVVSVELLSRFYRAPNEEVGRPDYLGQDELFVAQYDERMTLWHDEYERAKCAFEQNHDTIFPPGTLKLRRYGVEVATLSEDDPLHPSMYQHPQIESGTSPE